MVTPEQRKKNIPTRRAPLERERCSKRENAERRKRTVTMNFLFFNLIIKFMNCSLEVATMSSFLSRQ